MEERRNKTSPSTRNDFKRVFPKIDAWDKKVGSKIYHAVKGTRGNTWARYMSYCGDPRLWGPALILLFIVGIYTQDFSYFVVYLTGFVQAFLVYYFIKSYFKRPRPFVSLPSIEKLDNTGTGYSFPSGHTHHSAILMGLTVLFFYPQPVGFLLLLLYTTLVGVSRIISGVHYPSDVIVGALLAYCMLAFHWYITKDIYLTLYNLIFQTWLSLI